MCLSFSCHGCARRLLTVGLLWVFSPWAVGVLVVGLLAVGHGFAAVGLGFAHGGGDHGLLGFFFFFFLLLLLLCVCVEC